MMYAKVCMMRSFFTFGRYALPNQTLTIMNCRSSVCSIHCCWGMMYYFKTSTLFGSHPTEIRWHFSRMSLPNFLTSMSYSNTMVPTLSDMLPTLRIPDSTTLVRTRKLNIYLRRCCTTLVSFPPAVSAVYYVVTERKNECLHDYSRRSFIAVFVFCTLLSLNEKHECMRPDLIMTWDSHQQALVQLLSEHSSLFGLNVKVLSRDTEMFPGESCLYPRPSN